MTRPAPIFYKRDDRSLRRLDGLINEMIIQCKEEFDAGFAHGTLCSKRPGFAEVQATGKRNWPAFEEAAHRALVAATSVQEDEPERRHVRKPIVGLNFG